MNWKIFLITSIIIENESIMVVIAKKNGEEWELDIENDYQDLGSDL